MKRRGFQWRNFVIHRLGIFTNGGNERISVRFVCVTAELPESLKTGQNVDDAEVETISELFVGALPEHSLQVRVNTLTKRACRAYSRCRSMRASLNKCSVYTVTKRPEYPRNIF